MFMGTMSGMSVLLATPAVFVSATVLVDACSGPRQRLLQAGCWPNAVSMLHVVSSSAACAAGYWGLARVRWFVFAAAGVT